MIKSGGLYLNNNKIEDFDKTLTKEDLAVTNKLVIRVGRKKYHLISFE
jgi:tyrosyl-tRNA synthetase